MSRYEKHIDEWIYLIQGNHLPHCRDQELMLTNNVIPVLEREDVYVDAERIERGLSLMKYFPFDLLPWEEFLFALIAGVFLRQPGQEDDVFFHVIRNLIARGAGKNGFISFLGFFFISPFHGVKEYNVDIIANGEEQATKSIRQVYNLLEHPIDPRFTPALKSNYSWRLESITGKLMEADFRLNTSSTKNKDSKTTGCVIYDEKHQYTSTENMSTLKSGLGKVKWWREISITTDGMIRGGVLDDEKQQNEEILRQYNPMNRTLVFNCRIEDPAKWNDMDELIKANPSLAYPSFAALRSTIQQEIIDMPFTPDYFPMFMAKRCNYPKSDPQKAVAEWEDITAGCREPGFEITDGMACVGGVDYTKTNDFVGCVLLFRKGGEYAIKHHTFICRKSRDLPNIHAPIQQWAEEGVCTIVDGVEIPADIVAGWFADQAQHYNIRMIGVDNYRISLLNAALKKVGFDCWDKENKRVFLVRPTNIVKASPIINSAFLNRRFSGFDRMMCWYTNNTKAITDNKGNVSYGKIEPKRRKTDGFQALVHAFCCLDYLPEAADLPDLQLGVYTF